MDEIKSLGGRDTRSNEELLDTINFFAKQLLTTEDINRRHTMLDAIEYAVIEYRQRLS